MASIATTKACICGELNCVIYYLFVTESLAHHYTPAFSACVHCKNRATNPLPMHLESLVFSNRFSHFGIQYRPFKLSITCTTPYIFYGNNTIFISIMTYDDDIYCEFRKNDQFLAKIFPIYLSCVKLDHGS
ncbi:unnamed protein product [Trifolium pratense]|uniref:Uncharacterized protein n=1 Tax=Trifolium pratense TaxID=57577 RepID=A0ACB0LLS8_TRIPR|nr:unnamed protein product [Trifolium pratense]